MNNVIEQLRTLRDYADAMGWASALRVRFSDLIRKFFPHWSFLVQVNPRNSEHRLIMRAGTSDREVLGQVFIEGEYSGIELNQPKMIVDLGANVGYSSAYFLSKYPTANALAIEPDSGNFEICRQNLAPYGERAKIVRGAVWPERAQLALDKGNYRDGRDWATRVKLADQNTFGANLIAGYDLPSLIAMRPISEIDLLKIDIEGTELDLFAKNTESWLPRVKNICIELHGPDCEAVFFRALARYSYDLDRRGDLTICLRLNLRQPS